MSDMELERENLRFKCSNKWGKGCKEDWYGDITILNCRKNYVEFLIMSRSSLYVICGKGNRGPWACVPDYMAGCDLSMQFTDTFYNMEKLYSATKNKVDAITIAEALKALDKADIFQDF